MMNKNKARAKPPSETITKQKLNPENKIRPIFHLFSPKKRLSKHFKNQRGNSISNNGKQNRNYGEEPAQYRNALSYLSRRLIFTPPIL